VIKLHTEIDQLSLSNLPSCLDINDAKSEAKIRLGKMIMSDND